MKQRHFLLGIFMMVFTIIPAQAVLVTNGGFDINAADWNAAGNSGGGGTWAPGHMIETGNGFVTLSASAPAPAGWSWAVWYQVGVESLDVLGIPVGTTIRMSTDIKEISGNGNLADASIKIEAWDDSGKIEEFPTDFLVTTNWATYFLDYTIPAGTTGLKCVVINIPEAGDPPATYGYDNVTITIPGGTPALKPVPIVGGALASPVLSWTNPDPNSPGATITADVYILASTEILTYEPNLGPDLMDPGVDQIGLDVTAESLDLSGVGIESNRYYYWAVHITDSESGLVKGFNWNFQTFNVPPTNVSAGVDQYLWLTMDDGTPADGKVTFTLEGDYTDDGVGDITIEWTEGDHETDPATIVTIHDPNKIDTDVTIDNTGWFFFTLTVSDYSGSGSDTVNVGVYVDACEAANEDPDDIPATYPNGHGDIDGDCDIDLDDLALMAASWLDCMSDKLECL